MLSADIKIREYNPFENLKAWEDLHATSFNEEESRQKRGHYLRWLHDNPEGGNLYIGAFSGDRLVGFLAFIGQSISYKGKIFSSSVAVSAITHPDFRRKGIYTSMVDNGMRLLRARGVDCCLGYTRQRKVLDTELRIGWKLASEGRVRAMPLSISSIVIKKAPFIAFARRGMQIFDKWLTTAVEHRMQKFSADISCASVKSFGEEYDELSSTYRASSKFRVSKSRAYLEWKYLSKHNPFQYDIMEIRSGSQFVGCVIGREMRLNGLRGYTLLDMIIKPERIELLKSLISKHLQDHVLRMGYDVVACMSTVGSEDYNSARKLGFLPTSEQFSLIYYPLSGNVPNNIGSMRDWENSWGNMDVV